MDIRQGANIAGAPSVSAAREVGAPILPGPDDPAMLGILENFAKRCRHFHYSKVADILLWYPEHLEDGFTVEDEDFAYRVSFDRTRVVAIELHNFHAVFLRQNPEFARAWKISHSRIRKWLRTTGEARRFILDWLAGLVRRSAEDTPHRLAM